MAISFAELRHELDRIRKERPEAEVIGEVLRLIRERYEDFDAAARREADRIMDGMIHVGTSNARKQIGTLEDGPEKRSLARLIARSDRTHVTAYDLIATLESKTSQTAPVVSE